MLIVQGAKHRLYPKESLTSEAKSKSHISMRVTVRPEPGITLSHRWGDALRVTLTQLSRAEMLRGIKLTSLPMTFQDAIILARNLGVSYLWIDALCIIQDSKSDWALESAEMSRIYSCSLLTIAASSARDSETEFLYQRVPQPPMLFEDASTFWPPVKGDNLLEVRTTAISPLRNIRSTIYIRRPLQPYKFFMDLVLEPYSPNQLQTRGWFCKRLFSLLGPFTFPKSKCFGNVGLVHSEKVTLKTLSSTIGHHMIFRITKPFCQIDSLIGLTCNKEVGMVGSNDPNFTPSKLNGSVSSMNTAKGSLPTNLIHFQLFRDVLQVSVRLPKTCISLASGFLIFHVVSYCPPKTVSLLGAIKRRRGAGRYEIG